MPNFFSSTIRHIGIPIGHRTAGFRFSHPRTIVRGAGNLTAFGVSHPFPPNIHNFINNNSSTFGIPLEYAGDRSRFLENREITEAAFHHPLLRRPQISWNNNGSSATNAQALTAPLTLNERQNSISILTNMGIPAPNIQNNVLNMQPDDTALQRLMVYFFEFYMFFRYIVLLIIIIEHKDFDDRELYVDGIL